MIMKNGYSRKSVLTGITSFLIVLFTMPLGHALMICMEHMLSSTVLHYMAFAMGAVGLMMAIIGVFAKGDTRQTLWGLFGGLLFWTGWVEPMAYKTEMITVLIAFFALLAFLFYQSTKRKND